MTHENLVIWSSTLNSWLSIMNQHLKSMEETAERGAKNYN